MKLNIRKGEYNKATTNNGINYKEGNFLLIDDYLTELEDLITGIKIAKYEEEQE